MKRMNNILQQSEEYSSKDDLILKNECEKKLRHKRLQERISKNQNQK